jgi:hypothetical protein
MEIFALILLFLLVYSWAGMLLFRGSQQGACGSGCVSEWRQTSLCFLIVEYGLPGTTFSTFWLAIQNLQVSCACRTPHSHWLMRFLNAQITLTTVNFPDVMMPAYSEVRTIQLVVSCAFRCAQLLACESSFAFGQPNLLLSVLDHVVEFICAEPRVVAVLLLVHGDWAVFPDAARAGLHFQ